MTALVARFKNFSGMNFDGAWVAIFLVILAVGLFDPRNFVLVMDQAAFERLNSKPARAARTRKPVGSRKQKGEG